MESSPVPHKYTQYTVLRRHRWNILSPYGLQSGEGRPGLEAVLRGKACSRERGPVPAVGEVAVEVSVSVVSVVRICCHPSFLLWLRPIGGTGDQKGTTLVLLGKNTSIHKKQWKQMWLYEAVTELNMLCYDMGSFGRKWNLGKVHPAVPMSIVFVFSLTSRAEVTPTVGCDVK